MLDTAFAVSDIEVAGEIAGFLSVPKQVGSWFRQRGERAVRGWVSDEASTKVFELGFEKGRTLPLPEHAQRILTFTKKDQYREAN